MSDLSAPLRDPSWARLPRWLRPGEGERRGRALARSIETAVLVVIGSLLAVAVAYGVVHQVRINHRLDADEKSWRAITGHHYRNLSTEQSVKANSAIDIVCGSTAAGAAGRLPEVCLIFSGPVDAAGERDAIGGYYLPPYHPNKQRFRYACFGSARTSHECAMATPPGLPDRPLLGAGG